MFDVIEHRWYQEEAIDALWDACMAPFEHDANGKPITKGLLVCLPTGTGKSVVIAKFLKRCFDYIPTTRCVMATHVKELIKQNATKLQDVWPLAPVGFYSSGMQKAETVQPIIFGGIQSLVDKFPKFGMRNFLIIDEAHLLNDDGSYLKFINELKMTNPYLIIIGLTATPFRLGMGLLTNGSIFTDIVYNLCTIDGFNRLFAEGYLCPLIPKRGVVEIDTSNLSMSAGDFNQKQLQKESNKRELTYAALSELVTIGLQQGRRSWLIFATGVEHANDIADMLDQTFKIPNVVVHSKRTDAQNEEAIAKWKRGEVAAAVNMNSLTTGIDNPQLDLIGCLRPTASTGLWVQMLGRGTRPYPGKLNCLALDYAGNTRRLGPINDPVIPKLKGQGPPGDAPVRLCGACGCYNHARAVCCVVCGTDFPINEKLNKQASTEELIRSTLPQVEVYDVKQVVYSKKRGKATGIEYISAAYYCGLRTFYEHVNIEAAKPLPRHKARDWFRQRYPSEPPATNDEILELAADLRMPKRIRVWVNKPYPEILTVEF